MSKWIAAFGAIFVLLGLFQMVKYLSDYNVLSQYGKGYMWGSGFLIVLGAALIFGGLKKKKTSL